MKPRIRELREAIGLSQVDLAEQLGMHVTNLNKLEKGKAAITDKRKRQLSDFFKVPELDLFAQEPMLVPLKGYIGAGAEVEAIDGANVEFIEAPADAHQETVAAIVRGDSMLPVFEDGTVIYWSVLRPPDTMLNRRCVVQLANGRILVKILRKGSGDGLYTLQSHNVTTRDIEDVVVEWAARIDWVKPAW